MYTHKRTHAHTHRKRLEGKSEEEKKFEIRNMQIQMLLSVVDGNRKAVESDPKNAVQVSLLYFIGPFWTETARLAESDPNKKKICAALGASQEPLRVGDAPNAQ